MKPLLVIFFILLFLPGLAQAADSEKLKIVPAPMNFTKSELDLNGTKNIHPITNPVIRINDTEGMYQYTPKPGVLEEDELNPAKISVGAQMIKEGLESTVVDNVNNLFASAGGLQLGDLNSTEQDASEIAIFAVTAHTIDPTRDPAMMDRINTMRDIYIKAILLFGGLLALFLLYQAVDPSESAKLLEDFTGTYGYVAVGDMVKYYAYTCFWLLFGVALFFGGLKANNYLVENQMLSILDQVAFSSDSIGLYITFGVLWLFSLQFFAVRLVMIIIGAHVWYLYGLGFGFKKTRWAAILITSYVLALIFSQFIIVWISCTVVDYTTSQELAWYSVSFVYLGLFLTIVLTEILFIIWPILWKLLSPKTLTTAIRLARYV
jgi:hypothetical protein